MVRCKRFGECDSHVGFRRHLSLELILPYRVRCSRRALLGLMVSVVFVNWSEASCTFLCGFPGPAKVFTQRGAYRQCFLRITAEQEDRYNSMNLALASDRTIPISVEYVGTKSAVIFM